MVCSGLLEYLRKEYGLVPVILMPPYTPLIGEPEDYKRKERP